MVNNHSWEMVPFESLLEIPLRNGIYKKKEFHGRGCKIVNMGELFGYPRLKSSIEMNLVELTDKEKEKSLLETGDLIFARRSLTAEGAGKCTLITKIDEPTTFESSIIRARLNAGLANPEFYYYLFNSPFGKWLLGTILRQTAVAGITGSDLAKLLVPKPPKHVQDKIAENCSSLDDKIELNRQTNQTLEQMAQALFKSWFVDFDPVIDNALAAGNPIPPALATRAESRKSLQGSADNTPQLPEHIRALFPERFTHHPDRGWIPEGWEVNPIGKVIDNVGGGTPKTKEGTFWIGGTHPFCTPKDMSSLTSKTLLETERHLTEAGVAKISSGQLPQGTVLMSSRAPIGYLAITDVPVSVNQGIIAMKPNELFSSEYILSWAEASMEEVVSRANGSTFLEISKKNFREIPFLIPSADVLKQFDAIAKPYFQRITSIQKDVDQLTKLRDTLLPKLISGELRLPNTHQPEPDTKKKDSHETHGY